MDAEGADCTVKQESQNGSLGDQAALSVLYLFIIRV